MSRLLMFPRMMDPWRLPIKLRYIESQIIQLSCPKDISEKNKLWPVTQGSKVRVTWFCARSVTCIQGVDWAWSDFLSQKSKAFLYVSSDLKCISQITGYTFLVTESVLYRLTVPMFKQNTLYPGTKEYVSLHKPGIEIPTMSFVALKIRWRSLVA